MVALLLIGVEWGGEVALTRIGQKSYYGLTFVLCTTGQTDGTGQ